MQSVKACHADTCTRIYYQRILINLHLIKSKLYKEIISDYDIHNRYVTFGKCRCGLVVRVVAL